MRLYLAAAVLSATAFLGSALHATVIVPAEFREVVAGSTLIAHGRVIDVEPQWADDRRRIDSLVTVRVISWFKGGSASTLSFVVPGGEIGRYRHVLVGAPVFKPGEEAFLFLKTSGSPLPYVFGLNQGVFRISADDRGVRMVTSPLLLAQSVEPEIVRRGAVDRQPLPLDLFGAQIKSVLAARTGAR
jgi:hypothetical protein